MPDQQNPIPPAYKAQKGVLAPDQGGSAPGPITNDEVTALIPKEVG